MTEQLYNPQHNQYLPEHVAEDYNEYGHTISYKTEVILETPIDKTLKELTKELLQK